MFHYAPGRGAEHAKALIGGYQGIVQCKGWPNSRIDELMPWCWADADKG